ncbi:hypothetical protein AVEN_185573-1 [Araneus ventricosus]|uniref:Uncharacterized protein n=1 Tax=Araneus ventricosus TaxID=182803 RepID=A0A4Y2NMM2_ARAVE|nr:hypothetical protein AVEN_185573-1 [Araneus ventricosus]
MLHANELPLRQLILEMDGCTKGPYSYSGTIGLLLKDCEKTPVVKFDQIDCTLQPLDLKDIKKLITDQQYLYRICLAIKDGSCFSSVTDNSPGKLSHARWLTTAKSFVTVIHWHSKSITESYNTREVCNAGLCSNVV